MNVELSQGIADDESRDEARTVRLAPAVLAGLSQLSALRTVAALAREWGLLVVLIGGFSWLARAYPLAWVGYPVVALLIASRQHALAVLMHDATHWRLFRSKAVNDLVGELLTAWPLLISLRVYRANHFAHHRHVNTLDDPDFARKQHAEWVFPMPRRQLAGLLLKQLTGVNTLYNIRATAGVPVRVPTSWKVARWAYYLTVLGVVIGTGSFVSFLLLWVVPILSPLQLILRWRSIAEHFGVASQRDTDRTRTTIATPVERVLLAPFHVGYHLEHHLFPSVPHFRLRELHDLLVKDGAYARRAHVTRGYLTVLAECAEPSHRA